MILDIRYINNGPRQFQGVKSHTVFVSAGELIIEFYDRQPIINIPLSTISAIRVTND